MGILDPCLGFLQRLSKTENDGVDFDSLVCLRGLFIAGLIFNHHDGKVSYDLYHNGSWGDKVYSYVVYAIATGILMQIIVNLYHHWGWGWLPYMGAVVAFVFVPMYITDFIHMLQYNFKERDSKRILKLEQELKQLQEMK